MSGTAAGSARRRGRQAALQALYAADLGARPEAGAASIDEVFERVAEHFELPEGARAFAKELVAGVGAHQADLDAALAQYARNWRLSRMAVVDRNILRLAAYEIRETDTPVSVILDEAIELARRFGAESSPAFVNGVLDALARQVRGDAA